MGRRPESFGERWRNGQLRTRALNALEMASRLEGPGSERRLQRLQRRFRKLNAPRREASHARLGLIVFSLILVLGLVVPWLLERLT